MGSHRKRSLIEGLYVPYRSLMEALYTLNTPPVASFNLASVAGLCAEFRPFREPALSLSSGSFLSEAFSWVFRV